MTETNLKITVEELALFLAERGNPFARMHTQDAARRMLAADAMYQALADLVSSETKHTPGLPLHARLPWRAKGRSVYGPPHPIDGGDYAALCEFHTAAEAGFVVLSVNSHADLLAVVEAALEMLTEISHYVPDEEFEADGQDVNKMRARLEAAIAKVKGGA